MLSKSTNTADRNGSLWVGICMLRWLELSGKPTEGIIHQCNVFVNNRSDDGWRKSLIGVQLNVDGRTFSGCLCYRTDVRANVPIGREGVPATGMVGRAVDAACRSCELLAGALLRSEAEVRWMESLQGQLERAAGTAGLHGGAGGAPVAGGGEPRTRVGQSLQNGRGTQTRALCPRAGRTSGPQSWPIPGREGPGPRGIREGRLRAGRRVRCPCHGSRADSENHQGRSTRQDAFCPPVRNRALRPRPRVPRESQARRFGIRLEPMYGVGLDG